MGSVSINHTIVAQSCHVERSSQCSSVQVASEIKGTCLINILELESLLETGTRQNIISEEAWLKIKGDNELRPCAKSLRTAVGDSVTELGVAS